MELANLISAKNELVRFDKKLDEAIAKFKADKNAPYGCKEAGAVKRAAMDLKNELHKISK